MKANEKRQTERPRQRKSDRERDIDRQTDRDRHTGRQTGRYIRKHRQKEKHFYRKHGSKKIKTGREDEDTMTMGRIDRAMNPSTTLHMNADMV